MYASKRSQSSGSGERATLRAREVRLVEVYSRLTRHRGSDAHNREQTRVVNPLIQAQRNEYKQWAGGVAAITWLVSGLFLFLTTPGASLFSIRALLFFTVGMFLAAIIYGGITYILYRLALACMVRLFSRHIRGSTVLVTSLGWLLFALNVVMSFLGAQEFVTTPMK